MSEQQTSELSPEELAIHRDKPTERMMSWFEYAHLPEHLQIVSKWFHDLAANVVSDIQPGPERTVALRKLLEAKDAAVRAALKPGG